MNAADTNVYVYALDTDEPVKQSKAIALFRQLTQQPGSAVLLWQVAAEFLSQLRKWKSQGRIGAPEVESAFRRASSMFALHTPTEAAFQISFDLQARFSLSHWDSMLLAACKEAGVTKLFSEDMDAGTDYDGIAVVNPFT